MSERKKIYKKHDSFEYGKIMPSALDMEKAVLGSVIIEYKHCYKYVEHFIKKKMFYKEEHRLIWEAITNLSNKKEPVELLLLVNKLKQMGKLEEVGGAYYVALLTNRIASTANINYWARIIYQKWLQREVIRISNELSNRAYNDTDDIFDILDDAEKAFKNLDVTEKENVVIDIKNATKRTFNDIIYFNDMDNDNKNYYPIQSKKFDDILAVAPGLSLWAGAGNIGKSIFNSFVMSQLLKFNKEVSIQWFCIDHEDEDRIIKRWISQITGFSDSELSGKKGRLTQNNIEIILMLRNTFDNYDIEFINKPTYINDIHKRFIKFCEKRPDRFNILIIDNIMRLKDNRDAFNQLSIDDNIANTLADIRDDTKQYNSHILALHHFTKESISNLNLKQAFRPSIGHIRGSSRYENIMEQVILLNRPGNYGMLLNDMKEQEDILKNMFITEIAKNSYGETGIIRWWCNMNTCTFKEIEI